MFLPDISMNARYTVARGGRIIEFPVGDLLNPVYITLNMLTALTTIGGLLPLTLRGGTLWAPMGWTIIGGLLVSTLLTLVIVPVIYKLLEMKRSTGVPV